MFKTTQKLMFAVLGISLLAAPFVATAAADPDQNESWLKVRKMMFQDREIHANATDVLQLWVPKQAENAAVVPVMIRTKIEQTPQRYIKNVWLMIDNNPSPVGVKFTMTPESGRADIETRVRVETYSPMRVIAEMNDNSLWMHTTSIIAAGGCSAAVIVTEAQLKNMGKMKFKVDDFVEKDKPVLAQLMINHPNASGLAMNGADAQFIKQVNVYYADKLVMSADIDFTISENPNFRFYFLPKEKGELRAEVVDTADLRFETKLVVNDATLAPAQVVKQ
jgi:sulfur-oxidizing protein SoxY